MQKSDFFGGKKGKMYHIERQNNATLALSMHECRSEWSKFRNVNWAPTEQQPGTISSGGALFYWIYILYLGFHIWLTASRMLVLQCVDIWCGYGCVFCPRIYLDRSVPEKKFNLDLYFECKIIRTPIWCQLQMLHFKFSYIQRDLLRFEQILLKLKIGEDFLRMQHWCCVILRFHAENWCFRKIFQCRATLAGDLTRNVNLWISLWERLISVTTKGSEVCSAEFFFSKVTDYYWRLLQYFGDNMEFTVICSILKMEVLFLRRWGAAIAVN